MLYQLTVSSMSPTRDSNEVPFFCFENIMNGGFADMRAKWREKMIRYLRRVNERSKKCKLSSVVVVGGGCEQSRRKKRDLMLTLQRD
jgi:hypothetical protein